MLVRSGLFGSGDGDRGGEGQNDGSVPFPRWPLTSFPLDDFPLTVI